MHPGATATQLASKACSVLPDTHACIVQAVLGHIAPPQHADGQGRAIARLLADRAPGRLVCRRVHRLPGCFRSRTRDLPWVIRWPEKSACSLYPGTALLDHAQVTKSRRHGFQRGNSMRVVSPGTCGQSPTAQRWRACSTSSPVLATKFQFIRRGPMGSPPIRARWHSP